MLHPYRGLQILLTNFFEGISMLYTFFYTATRLKITIYAQTLAQAYARKPAGNAVLVIAKKGAPMRNQSEIPLKLNEKFIETALALCRMLTH